MIESTWCRERGRKPLRLLVVDDEVHILEAFTRAFRKDFDMVCATNGAEALDLLESREFDFVLSDYAMPGMNGVEFLKSVAQRRPNVVRLLVTAHYELPEICDAKQHGVVKEVIAKPWSRSELLGCLSRSAHE